MTHRSDKEHHVSGRRWLPWVILALAVVFLTRGFEHVGPMRLAFDGGLGIIPMIVMGAIGYFLWTWWHDDEDESEDGKSASTGRRHGRHGWHGHKDHAERVLRERFANGEIDEAEYLARKTVLED